MPLEMHHCILRNVFYQEGERIDQSDAVVGQRERGAISPGSCSVEEGDTRDVRVSDLIVCVKTLPVGFLLRKISCVNVWKKWL